jgi:hypothetical protein
MPSIKGLIASLGKDFFVILKIILSGLTAASLIFFISAMGGIDLKKSSGLISELEQMLSEINAELEGGIEKRIKDLGEVPAINPYKKFYCTEFAKEIHEVSYLTEKQKILFDEFNVRDFEQKSKLLVKYTGSADIDALSEEFETVKRELKNSANLIIGKQKKLSRQRIAFIVFFFFLWIIVYIYYSRGIIKRFGD